MTQVQELRKQARRLRCPQCYAPPGAPCRTNFMSPMKALHSARLAAARELAKQRP